MGTSKSPDAWKAGALLYSGRRDPEWSVPESLARQLQKRWKEMPPSSGSPPDAPGLGYRGAFLRGPDGREWVAFKGIVLLKTQAGVEAREDASEEFERILLASAPAGWLPKGLL
jgi:hypothetical protein